MIAGDLVIVHCWTRNIAADVTSIVISTTGGQDWKVLQDLGGAVNPPKVRIFWCRFNGTWSADPVFTFNVVIDVNSAVMQVIRPTIQSNRWSPGVADYLGTVANNTSPYTTTVTGITTLKNSTISIACWWTSNNHTFPNTSGTGWAQLGAQQYRNLAGNDQSSGFAYKIQTSPGATGNVSKDSNQVISAPVGIFSFYESAHEDFKIIQT
jgi:hypothetical protein